jgi:hypothetical protein
MSNDSQSPYTIYIMDANTDLKKTKQETERREQPKI